MSSFTRTFDGSNFSLEGLYDQKRPAKRTLLEAAPIQESRPLKKSKTEGGQQTEEAQDELALPAPDSFPPLHDDGSKPPHSYAQLIGMSILRAPARRLTLAQIFRCRLAKQHPPQSQLEQSLYQAGETKGRPWKRQLLGNSTRF
jgi:forkhead transcription factor HCM1